jgi:cyclopropane fatty-acyl-phospholipid synthase-like methyltransferase
LTAYAAKKHGTDSTGVTLARNQTEFGNNRIKEWGVSDRARILCMDYRDIPATKYNKITCLEMAEHVGVLRFQEFLLQVREMLEDDGLFYMQVAGLRATWQYEDFIWGLFMARYVFPGADASTPLYWYVSQLEKAGFEVKSMDTVGVHYSATIWKWYQNWMKNRDTIIDRYGKRWFRVWEIFLAWSTIVARQGNATCYQIVAHKNRNGFDRSALISKRLAA